MPTTGRTYATAPKGAVYSYNHATSTWVTLPITNPGGNYNVIKVDPYNPNKIVIAGNATLVYSTNGGTTQTASGGNWSTLCPNINSLSFTDDSNIIYGVGLGVIKSIDGGVTFNELPNSPIPVGFSGNAIHFTNSTLGVVSVGAKIFKTTDGGNTFSPLYGGTSIDPVNPSDPIYGLHISANGNTIIALTKRSVFRSTDGGNGFTNVFTFGIVTSPLPNLAFTYGNDNYFVITAVSDNFYRSDNAGASWISFPGQTPTFNSRPSTIYEVYKGFYTFYDKIYGFQETSPGVFSSTLSFTLPDVDDRILSLASSTQITPCYTLTPCAAQGSIITVSNDFSTYIDEYVQIDGSCFLVTESFDCVGTLPLTYTSIQSVADCTACDPPTPEVIYGLEDCSSQLRTLYTTEALTPGISGYVGDVLYIQGYPNSCWTVIVENGTTQAINILNDFATCQECIGEVPIPLPPPVYELENCVTEDIIYTLNSQFAQAVDQVVNLVGYPGECWSVTELVFNNQSTTNESIAVNTQGTLAIYENCQCCLPPVPPEPVKYTRVIPKPDRKFYQITQAQCDIQANIRFADNYHRLFKMLKYGINSMCDNVNLDRVWIKKMQSDLAVINDPTACIITTPVKPDVCPEPTGNPFIPPPPPVTYDFIVGGTLVDGIFNCSTCFDGSNPGLYGLCPRFNMTLDYNILDTLDPNATYVFSYNGACVFTTGGSVISGYDDTIETYVIAQSDIVNAGVGTEDPCASCQG
jgi:photosystem II stability/assembly factor-like uncharacterized protein